MSIKKSVPIRLIRANPCSIPNPCQSVFYFQRRRAAGTQHRCGDAAALRGCSVAAGTPPRCGDAASLRGRSTAAGTQHRCGDAAALRGRRRAAGTPPRCGDAAPLRGRRRAAGTQHRCVPTTRRCTLPRRRLRLCPSSRRRRRRLRWCRRSATPGTSPVATPTKSSAYGSRSPG
jgi:hypothetical protein